MLQKKAVHNMQDSEKQLVEAIDYICAKLCNAIDGDYDLYINPAFNDATINKIAMMVNFLLNSINQALDEREQNYEVLNTSIKHIIKTLRGIIDRDFNLKADINTNIPIINDLSRQINTLSCEIKDKTISSQYFQDIFNSLPIPLLILDTNMNIIDCNPASESLFKVHKSNLINKNFINFFEEKDKSQIINLRQNKSIAECSLITANQKIFPAFIQFCHLSSTGTINEMLLAVNDLTEAKKSEREKERFYEEIYNNKKIESIATLSSGIAHDFNNLLNIMLGNVELLKLDVSGQENVETHLYQLEQALKNAAALTRSLLNFSSEKDEFHGVVNLTELININNKLIASSVEKNITIIYELDKSLKDIKANDAAIMSIIINLLLNADYAMQGKGEIHLTTKNIVLAEDSLIGKTQVPKGQYVALVVQDSGCGIKNENINRIFDPFFTTKPTGKGHGLGLSAAYGIVKKYNGYIDVISQVGSSTTISMYFPITVLQEANLKYPSITEQQLKIAPTVLIVDDDKDIRYVYKEFFERHECTVYEAENGKIGVDLYKNHLSEITIVILDLVMPVMNGVDCLKELINLDKEIAVIICTGYADHGDMDEVNSLLSKTITVMLKPVSLQSLWNSIKTAMSTTKGRANEA